MIDNDKGFVLLGYHKDGVKEIMSQKMNAESKKSGNVR